MQARPFIPFHLPSIGEEEIREVEDTLRSGWLTTGPRTARFEREFAGYVGAPHAVALNSCTAALHVALAALNVGPGDEVITTPLTFCSTVHTILHTGAKPVLADVGKDGNIDPESIASVIGPRTRGILPVHLAGVACQMDEIWELAKKFGLFVVEDAAHAAGTHYNGHPIGAVGPNFPASDAVAFSFYATKNMTTAEGGMATSSSGALSDRMRVLSLHGMSRDAWNRYSEKGSWYYEVCDAGFKYNLTDIQSAIGIHQLRKLEGFIEARSRIAEAYRRELIDIDEVELPPFGRMQDRNAWHLFMIRLNLERLTIDRSKFIEELRSMGVGTSVHFIPIPLHPYFANLQLGGARCTQALELYPRLISLPLYPQMDEEQVRYIASCIREIARSNRKQTPVPVGSGTSRDVRLRSA